MVMMRVTRAGPEIVYSRWRLESKCRVDLVNFNEHVGCVFVNN